MTKQLFIIFLTVVFSVKLSNAQNIDNVKHTICYKTNDKISIDGFFDEQAWQQTEWITDFEDIRGGGFAKLKTQAKMLYNNDYLFIAIMFFAPHICAKITENEQQIYLDNAFELFIDPNGDGLNYYEFEINANGAIWDLQLDKPYSKGGTFNSNWNINGLEKAIFVSGTLNNPADIDSFWTIELAIPFSAFDEYKNGIHPDDGEQWRVNLLRVEWNYDIADGQYVKKTDENGKVLQSDLWVWSPQKKVNMHIPERWGIVEFKNTALRIMMD
jgi:hypothetical protein